MKIKFDSEQTLQLEVLLRLHHGRAGSTVELLQNHQRSDVSASGRSGTAYGHIAKGSGADGLRQAHGRGTATEQHSVGSRGTTTETVQCRGSIFLEVDIEDTSKEPPWSGGG